MRPLFVVVVDPGTEREARVLDGLIATDPGKLFFESFDEAFAEPVFLGCVGGDVFLLEPVVPDDCSVLA